MSHKNQTKEQNTLLEVADLSVVFNARGSYFSAVDNVSFKVNKGDFFGIIGESGSGKSTIGKTLVRLNKPSGGLINLDGRLIGNKYISRSDKAWLHQNAQMIFQDPMSSLNPIKTVLKLVSEPIMISKTVHKQAREFYKKLTYIRPYFRYSFKAKEFDLNYKYQSNYFKTLNQDYLDAIKAIDALKPSSSDYNTGYKEFLFVLDDISERVQERIQLTKTYLVDYKNILTDFMKAYDNKQYDIVDLEFDQAKLEQQKRAKQLKYSQAVIDLKSDKAKKQEELANIKKEFSDIYLFRNYSELLSWKTTIESEAKSFKQKMRFSNKPLDYSYAGINYWWKKALLSVIKIIKKDRYFEKERLDALIEKINHAFNLIFEPIVTIVINLSARLKDNILFTSEFNQQADSYLRLAKKLYLAFKHELTDERLRFFFAELESDAYAYSFVKQNQYLEQDYDGWKNTIQQQYDFIRNEIKNHIEESQKIYNEHNIEVYRAKKEIYNLNQEIQKAYEVHLLSDKTALEKNLQEAINVTEQKRQKRDKTIFEYEQTLPQIYAKQAVLTEEINKLHQEYKKLKNRFVHVLKDKIAALSNQYSWTNKDAKLLWSATKLRLKSMAINDFEYKITLSDKNVYQNLFIKLPPWLSWIYLFPLRSILIRDKVFDALTQVGLKPEHAYRYPHEFSGGQRQRIVIARALITEPKIVIADEPISALDVSIQAQIVNIMKELVDKKGVTFLFIAHDLSMVNYACNNVIIMHRGKILERGSVDKIFNNPIHPYTKSLMKASPKLSNIHLDLASFDEGFNYDQDYSVINKPSFFKISDNHEVFCTKEQFDLWLNQTH
ncbi:ATP-binding cassette domain-containing protein [Mycoplasma sp. E35C]|uniref:ATP-binding cassette domain-containing protein n=1 Tax=Mycoplasma sp. E35C TaxID=2801918 RepID=UPI001CA3894D|nr:ATP-binding cassette domain-containing protein [Mycoplasma sp. E35C]QZX48946.1 ATP-binding cassette domain-containing protein [Mycoplasma sp. E35C]